MASAIEVLLSFRGFREIQSAIGSLQASLDKLAKAGQSASERQTKAATKGFSDTAKAAEKSSKEATKAVEREAREAIRIRNQLNSLEVRDWQQKERAKTRAAEEEARKRTSAEKAALSEQNAAHARVIRDAESRARTFGRMGGNSVSRVLGTAGRVAATAAAIGGGFTVADSIGRGIQQEATAGIIFRGAAKKGGFDNQKQVQELAHSTAISTGGTTEDILSGMDQFVRKTGDLGALKEILQDMAKLSAATGTNFADMGQTAAEVQNQLGDAAKTMEVMRALAGQGKAGAIDIKDLGQYGGRLAASAAQFAGPLAGNIESFGALAQLAKKSGGATSTAEATEAVARLSSDFNMHQQGFRDLGVEVYSDKSRTKFRSAEDILAETVGKTKGDLSKIDPLFGEMSVKTIRGAQKAYTDAGGGSAGEAAIRGEFRNLKSNTLSKEDVDQGAKERLIETQAKLNIAMEQLTKVFNDRLLPKLPALIEQFERAIPVIGKVVDVFTNFPASSIVALIGAAFVADIAKAGFSNLVGNAIASAIRGGGSPATPGAASGAGLLGRGVAVAGSALAGYELGSAVATGFIDPMLEGEKRGKDKANFTASNVGSIESALRAGRISPEQAEEQRSKISAMVSQARVAGDTSNAGGAVLNSITGSGPGVGQFKESRAFAQNSEQVTKALDSLAAAIQDKANAIANVDTGSAGKGQADANHPSRGALAP